MDYNHPAWRRLRRFVLERDNYECYFEGCRAPATSVDHKLPVAEFPQGFLDPANCRASCSTHNYGRANDRRNRMARIDARRAPVRPL